LKRPFPSLDHLTNYPHDIQMLIIYSCLSLLNLIKLYDKDDQYAMEASKRFRVEIAEEMWEQYKEYLREHGENGNYK
jgi:hypothetical protein